MKKFFLFITSLLIFSCASKKDLYDVERITPRQKYTPPGTVWLRDNLFIDETEITNFSWKEFLYYFKRKDTAKYSLMIPDTTCWTRADVGFSLSDPLIALYWQHPA